MKKRKPFNVRLSRHKDELEWLFMELYRERPALQRLETSMSEFHDARPRDLQALDKVREANPYWYRQGTMFGMTMYTDLYAGTLRGLMERIPYMAEQKITYLHLMSLLKMPRPHNDGGYAVEDFNTVDPALGSNSDLAALTKLLRQAEISLCLDL